MTLEAIGRRSRAAAPHARSPHGGLGGTPGKLIATGTCTCVILQPES